MVDISVIISCYNPKIDLLKNTIISIVKQKNVNYEIIISDDGSANDYKSEIYDWLQQNNIKCVFNFLPHNVGTVANIYSALKLVNGKYIKPISPGDYLFDELSLSCYVDALSNNAVEVVFGKAVYYTADEQIINKCNPINTKIYKHKRNAYKYIAKYGDRVLGASLAFTKASAEKYLKVFIGVSRLIEDQPIILLSILNGYNILPMDRYLVWYEYGTGVTTQGANFQCKKDDENITKYISENFTSNLSKCMVKNRKIIDIENKYIKYLKMLFTLPGCFFYWLSSKWYKYSTPKTLDISQLKRIVTLDAN